MGIVMYKEISRKETTDLVAAVGSKVSIIVEGHIGSGKSSLINDLSARLPDHRPVYLDMTLMDVGDIRLPAVDHNNRVSTFYPNEDFGLHLDGPMILMLDEFGKADQMVKNSVLPMLVERRLGNRKFHEDTVVLATSNLGEESVGDMFRPHEANRLTFVRMAKPSAQEWIAWGTENGLAPEVLAWVQQTPSCFDSFEDVEDPNLNYYIYHPRAHRRAFVTPRSLAQASEILCQRKHLTEDALHHALMGTIGSQAASDMMAYLDLGESLPTMDQILKDPEVATIPKNPAALIMLCVQAAGWVKENTISTWMSYMARFEQKEAQAFFMLLVASTSKMQEVRTNRDFLDWAVNNNYLFS